MGPNDMAVHEALLFEILDRVSRIDMRLEDLTSRENAEMEQSDPADDAMNPMLTSNMLDEAIFSFTPTW
jgi:hypothetical protein